MSDRLRYRVEGMDCASCASRIEKAVSRVPGVSDVAIAVATETMSVSLSGPGLSADIERIVRDLGYEPRLLRTGAPAESAGHEPAGCGHAHGDGDHDHAGHDHDHARQGPEHDHGGHDHDHGHAGHDHAAHDHGHAHAQALAHAAKTSPEAHGHDHDHGAPVEGPWWQSRKGRTVLATGGLIAAAFLASWIFPSAGSAIYAVASLVAGIPIALHAVKAARYGSVFTIEMLMTIAVIGALAIGAAEEAAVVVFLFAVGELLEGIAAGRARAGIRSLARIAPTSALVEGGGGLVETPVERIRPGAVVLARPGDRVAADGIVLTGVSSVDESALTGESVPRPKAAGDPVFAGSINVEAALRIRVEKPASDTLIARVVRLVEEAAETKAPTERFIDRFARAYMPAICALALAVAILPPIAFGQDWSTWIYRGLTLLLIGCPCALVISTPAAIASALAAGARRGLLVKGGAVLEIIGKVRTIALDKTGTLTEGRPRVTEIVILDPAFDEREVLRLAAAVEASSSHPLAAAIVALARERGVTVTPSADSQVLPGRGVTGHVEGRAVLVGAPDRVGVEDAQVLGTVTSLQRDGKTVSAVVLDGRPAALIALRDEPRADARAGLDALKALGIRPVMLTGDNAPTGEAVAQALGIEAMTGMLPEDKLRAVKDFARAGAVAKVGDGINDAPALAAADVGIAMGSGTDVALEAADAAILRNQVGDVAELVRLSRRTMAVIHQNVAIALGLKAVFLLTTIVGVTGLWIAILADTGATVLVTVNALRLLRRREAA